MRTASKKLDCAFVSSRKDSDGHVPALFPNRPTPPHWMHGTVRTRLSVCSVLLWLVQNSITAAAPAYTKSPCPTNRCTLSTIEDFASHKALSSETDRSRHSARGFSVWRFDRFLASIKKTDGCTFNREGHAVPGRVSHPTRKLAREREKSKDKTY